MTTQEKKRIAEELITEHGGDVDYKIVVEWLMHEYDSPADEPDDDDIEDIEHLVNTAQVSATWDH